MERSAQEIECRSRLLRTSCAATAAALLLILTACASDASNDPDAEKPVVDNSEREGVLNEALPLELLLVPSEADYPLLDEAVNLKTRDCMKASGYEFEPYPSRPTQRVLDARVRYGYLSSADAADSGYRSTVPSAGSSEYLSEVQRIDEDQQQLGEDYLQTLYGLNNDAGCRGQASIEIWGSSTGLTSVPGYNEILDLSVQSMALLVADPEAREANSTWSICMGEQGYRYDTWADAPTKFLLPGSEVTAAEIEQAVVDARCRDTASLEPTLFEIETRIQNDLIAKSPFVAAFVDRIATAIDKAKRYGSET